MTSGLIFCEGNRLFDSCRSHHYHVPSPQGRLPVMVRQFAVFLVLTIHWAKLNPVHIFMCVCVCVLLSCGGANSPAVNMGVWFLMETVKHGGQG